MLNPMGDPPPQPVLHVIACKDDDKKQAAHSKAESRNVFFISRARPPSLSQEEKSPTPEWCWIEDGEITFRLLAALQALWRH